MERAFQPEACDFSGWATRNDLKCSDGRVIRRDAFKHDDGIKVPLVWNHQHNDPRNVLGHAWLENRPEGVYTYGFFNDSESGEIGKILVKHGDICALSIYANQLQQRGCDVLHGEIREVSLVHAGANPGAFIDSMLKHGEDSDDEAIIYTGMPLYLSHSATEDDKAREFIRTAIKARKNYKGSGQPTLYTTEDILTDCLLLTDTTGRDLYTDVAQLAKKLRVKEIVTVPVMEGVNGKNGGALMGIIVNLADYNVGADRGGAVNMFDDFDIDYNQQKYLIETRCSGALIKPYSAIALELSTAG